MAPAQALGQRRVIGAQAVEGGCVLGGWQRQQRLEQDFDRVTRGVAATGCVFLVVHGLGSGTREAGW